MKTKTRNRQEGGFIAFTSMLIISAITLAIAISISLLGLNEARNSLDAKRGLETLKIADACGEEAMYRLKFFPTYSGGTLIVGDGQCTITLGGSGEDRTITVTATISSVANYVRKIQFSVKVRGGGVVLRSRTEIP